MRFYQIGILFFCCLTYSQNNSPKYALYLDEYKQSIDQETYSKKCNSFMFNCQNELKDSIVIHSLELLFEFGKLDSIENLQVRNLFKKSTGLKYSKNKNLILILRDSIIDNKNEAYDSIALSKSNKNFVSNMELINSKRKTFDKNQKKCTQKFKNYDLNVIYYTRRNFNYLYETKYFKTYKIPKPVNFIFFKRSHYGYVILKPDGNYFYYKFLNEEILRDLLQNDWTEYIIQLNEAKKNNLPYPVKFLSKGFRKHETITYSKDTIGNFFTVNQPKKIPNYTIYKTNREHVVRYSDYDYQCYSDIYGSY